MKTRKFNWLSYPLESDLEKKQQFKVLRRANVISGWDFLETHHALPDLRNKALPDMKIPLLPKGHEVAACCIMSVLTPTKIAAMSETLITACVSAATPASPVPIDKLRCSHDKPSLWLYRGEVQLLFFSLNSLQRRQ